MTTGESDNIVLDAAEIWRAIGRLEGAVAALLEGQRELQSEVRELRSEIQSVRSEMQSGLQDVRSEMRSGFQDVRSEMQSGLQDVRSEIRSDMQSGFQDVHRRIDRLYFAVIGIGGALVAAVIVNTFVTG